jgi:SOUL heme-binding protein
MVRESLVAAVVLASAQANVLAQPAPQSTPEPRHKVISKQEMFELRRYDSYAVAQTVVGGSPREADGSGFRILFAYISGANQGAQKVEMTAPVVREVAPAKIEMTAPVIREAKGANQYVMQFVLPERFDMASAPRPTDARVSIAQVPARTVAVRQYAGVATPELVAEQTQILLQALKGAAITWTGEPSVAGYNAPYVPGFLRRNEVWVEVAQ